MATWARSRWRKAGEFTAPLIVRVPGGYHPRISDPWHCVSGEAVLAHALGWRLAFPSNARDAAGHLREALRSDDPTFFLEHRNLLSASCAATPYPGPDHALAFGRAKGVRAGSRVTVVTWGAMLYRALDGAARLDAGVVEVIDLRTVSPWDRDRDRATVAKEVFLHPEAPVDRIAPLDCPLAYERGLLDAVPPSVEDIASRLLTLLMD